MPTSLKILILIPSFIFNKHINCRKMNAFALLFIYIFFFSGLKWPPVPISNCWPFRTCQIPLELFWPKCLEGKHIQKSWKGHSCSIREETSRRCTRKFLKTLTIPFGQTNASTLHSAWEKPHATHKCRTIKRDLFQETLLGQFCF